MRCQIQYHSFAKYVLKTILCFFLYVTICNAIINGNARIGSTNSLCNNGLCICGYDELKCECKNDRQYIEITPNNTNSDVRNIFISKCHSVNFATNSIKARLNLRYIRIKDVYDLQLSKSCFQWDGNEINPLRETPKLKIEIIDSVTANIGSYSFKGNIQSITFNNFRIKNIDAFAFSSMEYCESIEFKNSIIKNVQVLGFKQFSTEMLLFENTTFENELTSRTFSEITVKSKLKIINKSKFSTLKPNAMIISSPRHVHILDSSFKRLESEAFKIVTFGDVMINNNTFEEIDPFAFAKISCSSKTGQKSEFTFSNNRLTKFSNNSLYLNYSSFDVNMFNVNINQTCACENLELWLSVFNTSKSNSVHCQYKSSILTLEEYQTKYCSVKSKTFKTIIIVISVLFVIILILVGITFYYHRRKKGTDEKIWINNASPIMNRKREMETQKNLPLIVPDGRTYKETELHVILERPALLTTEL